MKPGDLITLVQPIVRIRSLNIINERLPVMGQVYTFKCIDLDAQERGAIGIFIEEFSFGYVPRFKEELSIRITAWRVVEPMDISEVLEQIAVNTQ